MTEKLRKHMKDSPAMRWIALALISLTMFFAYFFVDVAAPLKTLLEKAPTSFFNEVGAFS